MRRLLRLARVTVAVLGRLWRLRPAAVRLLVVVTLPTRWQAARGAFWDRQNFVSKHSIIKYRLPACY